MSAKVVSYWRFLVHYFLSKMFIIPRSRVIGSCYTIISCPRRALFYYSVSKCSMDRAWSHDRQGGGYSNISSRTFPFSFYSILCSPDPSCRWPNKVMAKNGTNKRSFHIPYLSVFSSGLPRRKGCFRRLRDYPRESRQREHDVCDRVRLDWSVTVMADRQDVLRSELNKIILEISLNKNAPNHNKGYG